MNNANLLLSWRCFIYICSFIYILIIPTKYSLISTDQHELKLVFYGIVLVSCN